MRILALLVIAFVFPSLVFAGVDCATRPDHPKCQQDGGELSAYDANGLEIGRVISITDSYRYDYYGTDDDFYSPGGAVWVEYKFFYDGKERITPIRVTRETISGKFDYSVNWNAVVYSEPDCQGVASTSESKDGMQKSTVFEPPVIVVSSHTNAAELGLEKVSLAYIGTNELTDPPYFVSFREAGGGRESHGQCINDLSQAQALLGGPYVLVPIVDFYQEFTPPFTVK